jgi:hypothetical protein
MNAVFCHYQLSAVIPRESGESSNLRRCGYWIPAFAGMTPEE